MTPQTPMLIYPTVPLSALPDPERDPIMVNDLPMGPVCAAKAPAVRPAGRDLFGYDTEAAAERAKRRVGFRIEIGYKRALRDTRSDFAAARGRLGL